MRGCEKRFKRLLCLLFVYVLLSDARGLKEGEDDVGSNYSATSSLIARLTQKFGSDYLLSAKQRLLIRFLDLQARQRRRRQQTYFVFFSHRNKQHQKKHRENHIPKSLHSQNIPHTELHQKSH